MSNKIITMKDVAKEAGVSVMTVSRALKTSQSINQQTKDKVQQAVDKLGYVLNKAAGGLSSQLSGFVAILVPSLNNSHIAASVKVIVEKCENANFQVLLGLTDYRVEREEELVKALLAHRPEAFILTVDGHSETTVHLMQKAQIPIIEMWEIPQNPIQHVVGFSNYDAMLKLGEHLIQKGSRKIVYVGEMHDYNTRGSARRKAYIDLMAKHNLGEPCLIETGLPPINMEQGKRAFHEVIAKWKDVDTIMCVSDPPAFGIITEAMRLGYKIPSQLKVTGFGDFEISRAAHPSITTVAIDVEELGNNTGDLALKAIEFSRNKIILSPQIHRLNLKIEQRESS